MAMTIETREIPLLTKIGLVRRACSALPILSEWFWGLLCLLLFMLLGPFSAPVALLAVFSLRGGERGKIEPEPVDM